MAIAILYSDELREYDFGPGHPFRGDRYELFISFLKQHVPEKGNYCLIKAEPAADADLLQICSQDYVNFSRDYFRAAHSGSLDHVKFGLYHSMDNMPFNTPGNLEEAARLIIGQTKLGCELIQTGKFKVAVSIGGGMHHAKHSFGEGFCLYNDVAFATLQLLNNYKLKRIAIIDTDAHAGNGTSEYFYTDPRVLFIDIHQDPRTLYPGTGFMSKIGSAAGKGYTINVPLPPHAAYESYYLIFEEIVEPLIQEFKPQIIIRNGGADPHEDDGLTDLALPIRGFRMIGEKVRAMAEEICNGRELDLIASGYNTHVIASCWLALISGLAGWDINLEEPELPSSKSRKDPVYAQTRRIASEIKDVLKPYWKCFQHRNSMQF